MVVAVRIAGDRDCGRNIIESGGHDNGDAK